MMGKKALTSGEKETDLTDIMTANEMAGSTEEATVDAEDLNLCLSL